MQVCSDDLPRVIDSRECGGHSFGKRRIDGSVLAIFPDKPMKLLQSLPKTISPVLPYDVAEIVDTQSYRAVGIRKIKNSDVAVSVAYKSAVGA